MKAVLYELGEVLSEDERIHRQRDGEELPLWYIQVPETEAERSILTYAIEGVLGGDMRMHLRHDKHKQCRATLLLTGDWDSQGRLTGRVTISHVLSSEEQNAIREQLQRRPKKKGMPISGNQQSFTLGTYPVSYDKINPSNSFFDDIHDTPPVMIDEVEIFYLSILFPSEEGKVSGWFRILYDFPSNRSAPVALEVDDLSSVLVTALPTNHFHYHNPQRSQDAEEIGNDLLEDDPFNEEHLGSTTSWLAGMSPDERAATMNNLDWND